MKIAHVTLGAIVLTTAVSSIAQKHVPALQRSVEKSQPLVLTGAIPLPDVKGRIDHFGFDPVGNRLFVSALGNNTVEVIALSAQPVVHRIEVPSPQGVLFAPDETSSL